ncbi:hypothetical protein LCGC14_3046900 [marine sediment metagenome]|uniref:Uncharacterized protein n=1 Tax=marine sediment metagenome TaxID=412755 RepID=A0A0F8YVS9_9ZZZZ
MEYAKTSKEVTQEARRRARDGSARVITKNFGKFNILLADDFIGTKEKANEAYLVEPRGRVHFLGAKI